MRRPVARLALLSNAAASADADSQLVLRMTCTRPLIPVVCTALSAVGERVLRRRRVAADGVTAVSAALRLFSVLLVGVIAVGYAPAVSGQTSSPTVRVIGVERMPESFALEAAGEPATTDPEALEAWADQALDRILQRYRDEGYIAARGWHKVRSSAVVFEIDEGHMHRIGFLGANPYERITYSDNVNLPGGILHEPTLRESLDRLEAMHDLRGVSFSVEEEDQYVRTRLGALAPERVLYIRVVSEEDRGWGIDLDVDSTWGFTTGFSYDNGEIWGSDDHFHTGLDIAFPLQEYVFEQEPQLRWVYGRLEGTYRFPTFGDTELSPMLTLETSLANYLRLDIHLREGLVYRAGAIGRLRFNASGPIRHYLGIGVEGIHIANLELVDDATFDEPGGVFRPVAVGGTEIQFDDGTLRRDLRDQIALTGLFGLNAVGLSIWHFELTGQMMEPTFGRQRVVIRGRALYLAGDVRFYDELPLASDYQRTYFEDIYWVRAAAQIELGYRFGITRNFELGLFHDFSVFEDQTEEAEEPLAWANSFGPSLHLVLVDQFAFDVHYGLGFAPVGFSHNMTLGLETIY